MKKFKNLLFTAILAITTFMALATVASAEKTAVWLEAEEGNITGAYTVEENENASGDAGVVIQNTTNPGQVDFTFVIEEKGTYDIKILSSQRVLHLSTPKWSIDGSEPVAVTGSMVGSSVYNSLWSEQATGWYNITMTELETGEHTISIICDTLRGFGDMMIHWFDVVAITPAEWEWTPYGIEHPQPPIPAQYITISESAIEVPCNFTYQLSASVGPAEATNKSATWSTTNPNVASVSPAGLVTGVSEGRAVITATSVSGGFKAYCEVTVISVPVQSVTIYNDDFEISEGESCRLNAEVFPTDATNKKIIWTSSNSSVASVDANGVLTAAIPGTAIITATSEDGGFTDTCKVTVIPYVYADGITISNSQIEILLNETFQLAAEVSPENTTNKGMSWQSSNPNVATVSPAGLVTGVSEGTAVITVRSSSGGFTDTCEVTVKIIPVESLTLSASEAELSCAGRVTLTAELKPDNASIKDIIWTSSNPDVATVNNGVVTAVACGVTTITATSKSGGLTDSCEVTVTPGAVIPVWLEAEEGNITGAYTVEENENASGKKGVRIQNTTNPGRVDFTFVIEEKGIYDIKILSSQLAIHLSTPKWSLDGSDPASVTGSMVGSTVYDAVLASTAQATGWYNITMAELEAGEHTISIICDTLRGFNDTMIHWFDVVAIAPAAWEWTPGGITKPQIPIAVADVIISDSAIELSGGESHQLSVEVLPENATNKEIKWTSSNPAIATVDQNGLVTGNTGGTAIITAKNSSGNHTASCKVTVLGKASKITWINFADVVNTNQPGLGVSGEMVWIGSVQEKGTVYTFDVPFSVPEAGTYYVYLAGSKHGITHTSQYSDYRVDGVSKGTITGGEVYNVMGSAGTAPSTLGLSWMRIDRLELDTNVHTVTFEFNAPRPMTDTDYVFALKNLVLVPAGTELRLDGYSNTESAAKNAAEILMYYDMTVDEVVATEDLLLQRALANGRIIAWTSSHPNVIDCEGNVTRQAENTTVTLTASVLIEGYEFTREFEVIVPKTSPLEMSNFKVSYDDRERTSLVASVEVSEVISEDETAVFVLALYNDIGKLVSVSSTSAKLGTDPQTLELNVLGRGYKMKAFLWDNLTIRPLCDKIETNI